jgi:urease accessory protein
MNHVYVSALLVVGLVLSNVVHAHIGVHAQGSFASGLMHPFSGFDHLLAMIAAGLWAVQVAGRMLYAIPAIFIGAMALGAGIGIAGGALPFAESGIALSVLVLGALVAFAARARWEIAGPMIAVFALFHGYSHGTGMPEFSASESYLAGVLMATASLLAFGVATAASLQQQTRLLSAGGAAISLAGVVMILAA